MSELEEKIKKLEERLKQAKALKQKQDARTRAAEMKKKRAEDTRRKILAGAAILSAIESNEAEKAKFMALVEATLTRDDDRALFGLPPLASSAPPAPAPEPAPQKPPTLTPRGRSIDDLLFGLSDKK